MRGAAGVYISKAGVSARSAQNLARGRRFPRVLRGAGSKMAPRVDAHVHFYRYDPVEYAWIDERMAVIRRDFLPEIAAAELGRAGVGGLIAVQARQTLAESEWLIELRRASPLIRGVVGWVDLQSNRLDETLDRLAPDLVGVRHILQAEPDDAFMLRPDFDRGIQTLRRYALTYDILIHPRHLPHARTLVDRHPDQPFVLDHLAKPFIKAHALEPWATDLRELARRPNICAKLSGLVTEADWQTWTRADLRPYLETALAAFGPQRLMFGSDFPVCLVAASYAEVYASIADFVGELSPSEQDDILGGNAARFYGVDFDANVEGMRGER
jgi:L-fuconolactonase